MTRLSTCHGSSLTSGPTGCLPRRRADAQSRLRAPAAPRILGHAPRRKAVRAGTPHPRCASWRSRAPTAASNVVVGEDHERRCPRAHRRVHHVVAAWAAAPADLGVPVRTLRTAGRAASPEDLAGLRDGSTLTPPAAPRPRPGWRHRESRSRVSWPLEDHRSAGGQGRAILRVAIYAGIPRRDQHAHPTGWRTQDALPGGALAMFVARTPLAYQRKNWRVLTSPRASTGLPFSSLITWPGPRRAVQPNARPVSRNVPGCCRARPQSGGGRVERCGVRTEPSATEAITSPVAVRTSNGRLP